MATAALSPAPLPGEAALKSFAAAAALLLVEPQPRAPGARAVSRRAGVGLQHLDHRDYQPGDELRHMDWRQTARLRRPIVRRFESEAASDWVLLLDASSSMALHAAKWQAAVQAAAAMAYALLQVGHRVGLLVFGARVLAECPRGRGPHHFAAIARVLTTVRPAVSGERSAIGACAARLRASATAFALSDCLADDEMRRELEALRQRCAALHLLQVRDVAETRAPAEGEWDLVDVETGDRLPLRTDALVATRAAAAAREAMTARLASFCDRRQVAFTDWDVAQPWRHALLGHLERARARC